MQVKTTLTLAATYLSYTPTLAATYLRYTIGSGMQAEQSAFVIDVLLQSRHLALLVTAGDAFFFGLLS